MFIPRLHLAQFLFLIFICLLTAYGYNGRFRESEIRNAHATDAEIKDKDTNNTGTNKAIKQTLALLEEGDKKIIITDHTHVILVIGNTGAGKSTMTQFIAGDDSQLEAYRPLKKKTILIRDPHDSISTHTLVSKTIFPELKIDNKTNIAFYDCPGFSDTRNTTIEIVNSFFLKKISARVNQVKILIVVNHNSLIPGENRRDFRTLLKHTTEFLKNMEVFLPTISLVATKVRSLDPAEDIIQEMGEFIKDALEELNDPDNVPSQSMIKLLETLTETNDKDDFTRLTFFRQPNEVGLLSKNKRVQEQKIHILETLHNSTIFATTSESDFGFSLSDKAKNDIRNLKDIITKTISNNMKKVGMELRSFLEQLLRANQESSSHFELDQFGSSIEKLVNFFSYLQNIELTTNLQTKFKDFFKNLLSKSYEFTGRIGYSQNLVTNSILNNAEYMDFFEGISTTENGQTMIQSMEMEHWLKPMNLFQEFTKNQLQAAYQNVLEDFLLFLHETGTQLTKYFKEEVTRIEIQQSSDILKSLDPLLQCFFHTKTFCLNEIKIQNNSIHLFTFAQSSLNLLNFLDNSTFQKMFPEDQIMNQADYLDYFKVLQVKAQSILELDLPLVRRTQLVEYFNQFVLSTEPILISYYEQISKKFLDSTTQAMDGVTQSYHEYFQNSENLPQEDFKSRLHHSLNCFSKIQNYSIALKSSINIESSMSAVEFAQEFLLHVHCLNPNLKFLDDESDFENAAKILDLFAEIAKTTVKDTQSIFSSPKSSLVLSISNIQSTLTTLQNNLSKVQDIINTRIHLAVEDLADKLQHHYRNQLETMTNVDRVQLAQMDSNHFNKTILNIYQTQGKKSGQKDETNLNFMSQTLANLLSPMDNDHNKEDIASNSKNLMKEILEEISFLDFFQSQMQISIQNQGYRLQWLHPLQTFSCSLHRILFDPITCGYETQYAYDMPKDLIIAKGTFVSFNEAMIKCFPQNVLKTKQNILIMAKNTVFLDSKITGSQHAMNEYNIGIISPTWIITTGAEINVDGKEGQPHSQSKAGKEWNGSGSVGLPGLPGQNAGSFLGIGMNFRGARLKLSANGGNGGQGQEGGDGSNGSNGEEVNLQKINYKVLKRERKPNGYMVQVKIINSPYTCSHIMHECWHSANHFAGELPLFACVDKKCSGSQGQNGFNGGNGGQGGVGGHPGIINLFIPPAFSNSFETVRESGRLGSGGRGGKGGSGGFHGNEAQVRFEPTQPRENRIRIINQNRPWGSYAKNGNSGVGNYNNNGRQEPSSISSEKTLTMHSSYIRIYQNFMRQNADDPYHKNMVKNFLEHTNKVSIFSSNSFKYLKNLIDDYDDLDTQFLWLKKRVNFLHFYQQFLLKLSSLPKSQTASDVDVATSKSIITYLFTAAFGRVHNLNPIYDANLILNMASYLELTIEQIKAFDQKSHQSSALALISKIREDYNTQIQIKFQEADNLIKTVILPEIARIQQKMENSVNELLEEILKSKQEEAKIIKQLEDLNEIISKNKEGLQGQSYKEKQMLEKLLEAKKTFLKKKEEDLEMQIALNALIGIAQIGAGCLAFLGPPGMVAGGAIQGALSIGQMALGQSSIGQVSPQQISAIKDNIHAQIFTTNTEKLSKLSLLFQDSKTKLLDTEDVESVTTYKNLIITIDHLITEVNTEASRLSVLSQTPDMTHDKELPSRITTRTNKFIKEKITALKFQLGLTHNFISEENFNSISNNKTNETAASIQNKKEEKLEKLRLIQKILEIPLDTYDKVRESQAKIDAISKALMQSRSKISKLDEFAFQVETNMTLMLDESFKQLNSVQLYLLNADRTGSDLDVTRWQTVSYLEDMKSMLISQFTKGFNVNTEFSRCFDKLEDAFTTLIQIYDRMNAFQDQSRLGKFITDINSVSFQNVKVSHPELRERFQRLETSILSNTLMSQYEIILNSFKMASFPFADYYLGGVTLQLHNLEQSQSGNNRDSSTLVGETSRVLQEIRRKLIAMKSTHNELDTYFHKSPFYTSESTSPFYTWKEQESDLIQELLQGDRVYLKADILNSPPGLDAIKFSRVDLKFNFQSTKVGLEATNEKNQEEVAATKELEQELKHFKVHMTHMGNSYYRYEDKYYLITTSQVIFVFGFQKDSAGYAMVRNGAYEKVMSGDILLSPYTMWQIYLEPSKPHERDFARLKNLMRKGIDTLGFELQLELIGNGTYVDAGYGSILNVNNYYENV